jgi:hypothetical protein
MTVVGFLAPPFSKMHIPITLSIMLNAGVKMTGTAYIDVYPKTYQATVDASSTMINSISTYTISFNLSDPLLSTGYFVIDIPPELTLNSGYSVTLSSTPSSLQTNPSFSNSTSSSIISIKISNINNTATDIPVQLVKIQISGLVQPSSVQPISNFNLSIYYSSGGESVAQASAVTPPSTPGYLIAASVNPSSFTTADSGVTYNFNIQIGNNLNNGSYIQVDLPPSVNMQSGSCSPVSLFISCTAGIQTLTINSLTSPFSRNSLIIFNYSNFINPPSTRPTDSFNFTTLNNNSQIVDVLPSNMNVTITMTAVNLLLSPALNRDSSINSDTATYTISFIQSQMFDALDETAAAEFVFPPEVSISTSPTCSVNGMTTSCSVSGNIVNVLFTPISSPGTNY